MGEKEPSQYQLGDRVGRRGATESERMGIQDVIRWFLPREDHFYEFLEKQASAAHEGAKALSKFSTNGNSAKEAREAVQKIEPEGDRIVHEMEEALAKTFVTPIDREDLQKLS